MTMEKENELVEQVYVIIRRLLPLLPWTTYREPEKSYSEEIEEILIGP